MHHPPGRKVYQRGAHTIWEVDGAAQKVESEPYLVSFYLSQIFMIFFLAILPEFIAIRKVLYRRQDFILRLREL